MEKFIYVFSEDARDKLIKLGYKLIKSDERNRAYIFENSDILKFEQLDISAIKSNTLTF